MELKVWVDGIQRVICGVSPSTTCQDIVLALAHATGRTGRFTLIEKWRNNERPLAPVEQPLQVLQKWGEYATDVQFMLIQNDKTGLKTPSKSNTPPDKKDRFTHNFTPPHTQGDAHIKRSFTFSGAHSGNSVTSPNRLKERFRDREAFHESSISEESELGSSSTASPVSSSSKPSLPLRSVNHRLPGAPHVSSAISHNSPSNSLERSAQRKPPHRSAQSRPSSNGQVTRSNARPIPKPRVHRGNVSTTNGPKSLDDLYLSQNSPPDFQEARSSSPLPEFEEYDLDKNFPVTSKSAPSRVRGRSSQPRKAETSSSDESQEYSSLVRLVGIQQERLQLQESQISVVESEIQQLEERGKKDEERLQELEVEIRMWESKHGACERELLEIDSSRCQDQLDSEKQSEQILKSHIDSLRAKITESEKQLSDMNSKKDSIIKEIESVQKDISEQENRDKESEVKLTQETAETQKEIDTKLVQHKEDKDKLEELTKEVKVLDTTVQEKKDQISELENSLKEANLQQFVITPPGTPTLKGNNSEEGESAVFKQLSRPPGIRKHAVSPQDFSSTVSSTENPDGVWV